MKVLNSLLVVGAVSTVLFMLTGCGAYQPCPPGEGYLEIDTFPQRANVLVNDELVGQTPQTVKFSWTNYWGRDFVKGYEHKVTIEPPVKIAVMKQGYSGEVRIIRRGTDVVLVQEGSLDVYRKAFPAKARIMFYLRKSVPVSPAEIPSTQTTTPSPQQQQQMMGPTIVIGGKTVTGEEAVKIVNYGLVMFDSTPQGAEVLIEGNLVGYTPTAQLKFEVGTYNVEIVKSGYKLWKRTVMVIQDSSITIKPELESAS